MKEKEIFDLYYKKETSVRLDVFLADTIEGYSRSFFQKIIERGNVYLNGSIAKNKSKLVQGDRVKVVIEKESDTIDLSPMDFNLDIVFEDSHVIVINKPSGLTVHPAAGHKDDTLVNALLYHSKELSTLGGEERPGIVHRLDKNTSGLIVIAKTDQAHRNLQEQIQNRTMSRKYKALIIGDPDFNIATVNAPIGRHPSSRQKMAVIEEERYTSREAVTHVTVLKRFKYFTLIEAALETGRTHQIRVHMSYIKHPVLGDFEYGGLKRHINFPCSKQEENEFTGLIEKLQGQMLHAYSLSFFHPVSNEKLNFSREEPEEFKNMINWMENRNWN